MRGYKTMGSRGRMLGQAHWSMPDQYDCVDIKNGVKVLKSAENPNHPSLPDISHTKGTKYLSLDKNGNFKQLRIYDYSGRPVIDIDYGVHTGLSKQPTLHVHTWKGGRDSGVRLFSRRDYKKYGKYLKGLIKNEWIK